jgi:hypothetical protein
MKMSLARRTPLRHPVTTVAYLKQIYSRLFALLISARSVRFKNC